MRQVDWRALRGSIVLFVLALVIGGTTAGTATWFHDEARRGYERQKGRLETIRSRYRTIDEEKRLIETWLPEFRVLQAAGIIGEERRLVWIEALQAIAARLRLPSLQYRIEPRTAYDGELDLDTGDYRPFSTVVRLEAGLLHEGDVERLFEDLAIRNTGLYRIERCEIRRAAAVSPPARTPYPAPDTALAVLRLALRLRPGASHGRPIPAIGPPATPFRRREHALAGLLASALLSLAPVLDACAQARLGRLFSSPEQRIELDRLRNDTGLGEDAEPVVDRTESESGPEPERGLSALTATFNGVVIRSDGHRVAWIDGVETTAGATTPAGARIEADHAPGVQLRILWLDRRTSAVLEPGQSIDGEGRVREAYESRTTGSAADAAGKHRADSGGEDAGESAVASAESPEPSLLPVLPADLVRELRRGTRAGTAPLGVDVSGSRPRPAVDG